MDEKELYKLRAEDYARNFESLRTMEWQVVFQLYAGYTLLGGAYWAAKDTGLGWMFIAGIGLLFGLTWYLSVRIQERQEFARTMQNAYLAKLHEMLGAEQLEILLNVKKPKHQGWYAFRVQTFLSAAFALGLIAFILATT